MTRLDDILDQQAKAELVSYLQPIFFKAPDRTLIIVLDSGGIGLTTGIKGDVKIDYNCRVTKWTLTGDQSGSIVIDVWKSTYANFPPTVSITGTDLPTLASAQKATSVNLAGWTTTIDAGDHLRFNVNSVTGLNQVTLTLQLRGP